MGGDDERLSRYERTMRTRRRLALGLPFTIMGAAGVLVGLVVVPLLLLSGAFWPGVYAGLGLVCALVLLAYGVWTLVRGERRDSEFDDLITP